MFFNEIDFYAGKEAQSATIDIAVFTPDSRPALALFFHPDEVDCLYLLSLKVTTGTKVLSS